MIKPRFVFFFILLLFTCAACSTDNRIIPFGTDAVEYLDIYNVPVPAGAHMKTITEKEDIETVINTFRKSVRILGDGTAAEPVAGGALYFVFHMTDGTAFTLVYNGNTLQAPDTYYYEVESDKLNGLWSRMKYEAASVAEYELPFYPKDKVPDVGLRFMSRGDYYQLNAWRGGYTWSYAQDEETMVEQHADAPHPLEAGERMTTITLPLDFNEVELLFSMPPDSYTVCYWPAGCIGNAAEYENAFVSTDAPGRVIATQPDTTDGTEGYLYAVYAVYPQGRVSYAFYISKSEQNRSDGRD